MLSRPLAIAAMAAALLELAACTSSPGGGTAAVLAAGAAQGDAATNYDDNALSAGKASWRCDNGETYLVDNTVTQIVVISPDGQTMTMPATPADSRTRYVLQQYAFVVDGEEALFFRAKSSPLTCRKGPASAFTARAPASIDLKPDSQPADG